MWSNTFKYQLKFTYIWQKILIKSFTFELLHINILCKYQSYLHVWYIQLLWHDKYYRVSLHIKLRYEIWLKILKLKLSQTNYITRELKLIFKFSSTYYSDDEIAFKQIFIARKINKELHNDMVNRIFNDIYMVIR